MCAALRACDSSKAQVGAKVPAQRQGATAVRLGPDACHETTCARFGGAPGVHAAQSAGQTEAEKGSDCGVGWGADERRSEPQGAPKRSSTLLTTRWISSSSSNTSGYESRSWSSTRARPMNTSRIRYAGTPVSSDNLRSPVTGVGVQGHVNHVCVTAGEKGDVAPVHKVLHGRPLGHGRHNQY
jgi:hypothetical protein